MSFKDCNHCFYPLIQSDCIGPPLGNRGLSFGTNQLSLALYTLYNDSNL